MPESVANALHPARGATAEVYASREGRVLERFHEHIPIHASQVAATRAAHGVGLPVPAVLSRLIEVGQRKGIVFERIQGLSLTNPLYAQSLAECARSVADSARQMAKPHAQTHSSEASK